MNYRASLCDLLRIIERDGRLDRERSVRDQVLIAEARTLIATAPTTNSVVTSVICNIPLCPSRLELAGDLTPEVAATKAQAMKWWTDGHRHICPTCGDQ